MDGGIQREDDRLELIEVVHVTSTRRVSKAFDRTLRQVVSVTTEPLAGRDPDDLVAALRPYLQLPVVRSLAPLLDAYASGDQIVMVSPWVEGVDLLALLQASGTPGLPTTAVLSWLDEVGDAVRHLHRHGLVHGDVRPANLVLSSEQHISVIGLGTGVIDGVPAGAAHVDVRGVAATAAALLTGTSPSVGAITGTAHVSGAALKRALLPALDDHTKVPVSIETLLSGLRQELNAALPTGVVTFLLTDIVGSTRQWEADEASMATRLARHDLLLGEAVEAAGGRLLKARGEGDATFSVFTKASSAVRAAIDAQARLRAETSIVVRMAIHTGEAELREADYFGRTVNRAARLRSVAPDGGILLSSATADLCVDALPPGTTLLDRGTMALKDLDRAERAFQVVGPGLPAAAEAAPPSSPPLSAAPPADPQTSATAAPEARVPASGGPPPAPPPAPARSDGGGNRRFIALGAAAAAVLVAVGALLLSGGDGDGTARSSTTTAPPSDAPQDRRPLEDLVLVATDLPGGMTDLREVEVVDDAEECGQRSVDLDVRPVDRVAIRADDADGTRTINQLLRRYEDPADAVRAQALVLEGFGCDSIEVANADGDVVSGAVSDAVALDGTSADDARYLTLAFNGATVGVAVVVEGEHQMVLQYASFGPGDDALRDDVRTLVVAALRHLEETSA